MAFLCTTCDRRGNTVDDLHRRGCTCKQAPIQVLDQSDKLDIGNIGSYQKIQGKKITTIEIVGTKIKKLRPLSQIDGIGYVQAYLPVRKTVTKNVGTEENPKEEVDDIAYTTIPYFVNSTRELIPAEDKNLQKEFQIPIIINGITPRWEVSDLVDFVDDQNSIVDLKNL